MLGLCACAQAVAPGTPIDLDQAINHALTGNKNLRRVALAVDASLLREAGAKTEFETNIGPDVMLTSADGVTFLRYGPRISRKLASGTVLGVSAGIVTTANGGDTDNHGSVRVEIDQPIFRRFGKLAQQHSVHLSTSGTRTSRRKYELEKTALVLDVVRTYETVVRLEQQVHTDQEAIERLELLHLAARMLGNTRSDDGLDALRADLMLGEARLRLEGDREQLTAARRELAELMGLPTETVLELAPSDPLRIDAEEPEVAVRVALRNRLDYAQALQEQADAERAVTVAERALMPDLRLKVSYDDFATSVTSVGAIQTDQEVWFLSLTGPTDFNRARERIAVRQAQVNAESARISVLGLESAIHRDVLQRFHAHRQAIGRARLAERNMIIAENREQLSRQRDVPGRSDRFATAEAGTAFATATTASLAANAEVSITAYELSRAMGTLIEPTEDLKPTLYRPAP